MGYGLVCLVATGIVRENRTAKCPLKSSKILGKMDRGTSDRKFDTKNEIAAVRWSDNRVVSLITNFEDTRCFTTVERRMKGGKQKVDVLSCVVSYNKHKKSVDLFDNHMETYFSSIQRKKWYWPLIVNSFETSLVAAWKLSKFFATEQALDLLEFRLHITIAFLGLCVPRNIAGRGLGIQQKNPDYLKLQSEHILVKIPNGKQRRCQHKNCTKNHSLFVKNVIYDFALNVSYHSI
ncbi:PiggyBac transposable element-derived protein 3 [Araneus ventricosus]|uniref:PiggyBac transposable element-derived protein 3 n=1 Tax=Araneus ventricosus TaxID=182803 RepID=A0A4Y2K2Q1_ARAVE|nr:PiggyBac transposable element-derived protein 3 [Araneus ventricosus]